MRVIIIAVLLAIQCLYVGCTNNVSSPALESPVEFSLKIGSAVTIDDGQLTVAFTGLISDSRCPTNVVCIWPGEARISLKLSPQGGEPITIPLAVYGAELDTLRALNYLVDTLGYEFSLRTLSPYPEDPDNPFPKKEYVARIRIEKARPFEDGVSIVDTPPQQVLLAQYTVDSAAVVGDTLSIWVSYSGGCQIHEFQLFMTPSVFAESQPVQANLYLQHIDHFDPCEALLSERLDFDIFAIAEAYRALYQSGGTVHLNLYEFSSGSVSSAMQLVYNVP